MSGQSKWLLLTRHAGAEPLSTRSHIRRASEREDAFRCYAHRLISHESTHTGGPSLSARSERLRPLLSMPQRWLVLPARDGAHHTLYAPGPGVVDPRSLGLSDDQRAPVPKPTLGADLFLESICLPFVDGSVYAIGPGLCRP